MSQPVECGRSMPLRSLRPPPSKQRGYAFASAPGKTAAVAAFSQVLKIIAGAQSAMWNDTTYNDGVVA